jgi:hypothetical protein
MQMQAACAEPTSPISISDSRLRARIGSKKQSARITARASPSFYLR